MWKCRLQDCVRHKKDVFIKLFFQKKTFIINKGNPSLCWIREELVRNTNEKTDEREPTSAGTFACINFNVKYKNNVQSPFLKIIYLK